MVAFSEVLIRFDLCMGIIVAQLHLHDVGPCYELVEESVAAFIANFVLNCD